MGLHQWRGVVLMPTVKKKKIEEILLFSFPTPSFFNDIITLFW
ncbi:hypothetical protein NitYY0826_C1818 [Nitratiruptor sp. YY08-26]|nr:hypothetical protein NitYY0813_C1816 [Nitratiruptor sp. YY08-13]BCD66865.1 hypothetical protein NitYY0826_C1818 [Nitratiruptor sp. YY08-26]